MRATADMYVEMSALYPERDDLDAVTRPLLRSKELGEHNGLPQNRYRWCVAMSRLRQGQGDLDGALDLLNEAERVCVGDFSADVRSVATSRTRVWVMQAGLGKPSAGCVSAICPLWTTSATCASSSISPWPGCSWCGSGVCVPSASSLMPWTYLSAYCKPRKKLEGGQGPRNTAATLSRPAAHGDVAAALVPLQRALTLAEPEGYVRMFVDEVSPVLALLTEVSKQGTTPNYVHRLLSAFGEAVKVGEAERRTSVTRL